MKLARKAEGTHGGGLRLGLVSSLRVWLVLAAAAALLVALAPPAPEAAAVVQNTGRRAVAAAEQAARQGPNQSQNQSLNQSPNQNQNQILNPGQLLRLIPRQALDTPSGAGADLWGMAPPAPPASPPAAPVRTSAATAALAAAPEPPAAPPLPFRLLGRYADSGREGVVLQGPEGEVVIAHAGETLAGQYRVVSLSGNLMVLHYLPLDLRQTMDIGVAR